MGFNFGAFAGGAAKGIRAGSDLADQMQQRKLREAQINAFSAEQLGKQAYATSLIPGMQPVPAGANSGGNAPLLSRIPIIGDVGEAFGLWGPVPSQAAPAGPQMARGGPMPGPSASMPAASGQPPQAPGAAPSPSPMGNPMVANVATAIDRANPGLRQANPAAFAAAVQIGVEQMQQQQKFGLETDLTRAQIGKMGAEGDLTRAQVADVRGPSADLKRAQAENLSATTAQTKEETKLLPAKQKLEEYKVKLEELKADAAQAKMRLDEAELNAKVGDFASQREYRDAQIAKMRADRMLDMGKQKLAESKNAAEIENLQAQAGEHKAKINYYNQKATGAPDRDKAIKNELTQAGVQLRFHQGQINELMTSMNPTNPAIQARIREHQAAAQAYTARVRDLEGQLSTAPKKEEAPAPQEIKPERQTELGKVSNKILELSKTQDTAGVQRLVEMLKARGVPPHEIQWALDNARKMSTTAPTTPQVPQSR